MYQKILVPIDGSTTSERGLREAVQLVKSQGGQLRLFHMVSEQILDWGYASGTCGDEILESARRTGRQIMSDAATAVRLEGLQPETVMVESIGGSAAALIIAQAREWPADLIVMGTHGRRGFLRLAMGSDAESVVRETTIPVLLVHHSEQQHAAGARDSAASNPGDQILYA